MSYATQKTLDLLNKAIAEIDLGEPMQARTEILRVYALIVSEMDVEKRKERTK